MFGGFLGSLLTPEQQRKAITMKATAYLWAQAEANQHEAFWKSEEDKKFVEELMGKAWINYTEKEILSIDMLMLKYNDRPCDADLAKDRVLN